MFGALILSSWASRRVAAAFDHISFRELSTAYVENLSRIFAQSPDLSLRPPKPLLRLFSIDAGSLCESRPGSDLLSTSADAAEAAANRASVQVTSL